MFLLSRKGERPQSPGRLQIFKEHPAFVKKAAPHFALKCLLMAEKNPTGHMASLRTGRWPRRLVEFAARML
jgi:hypothetical protein